MYAAILLEIAAKEMRDFQLESHAFRFLSSRILHSTYYITTRLFDHRTIYYSRCFVRKTSKGQYLKKFLHMGVRVFFYRKIARRFRECLHSQPAASHHGEARGNHSAVTHTAATKRAYVYSCLPVVTEPPSWCLAKVISVIARDRTESFNFTISLFARVPRSERIPTESLYRQRCYRDSTWLFW